MSGRKESVAQRSFFHLSSMRNLFSYVDTAKVRWNGPKKPDGPTAKNLSEKASAQGPNRGGCPCAGTARPAGTSPTSAQTSGMPCAGTARPAGTSPTSAQSSGIPCAGTARPTGNSPTSAQSSGMPRAGTARPVGISPTSALSSGMLLSKGAKGRSKKGLAVANYKALRKKLQGT